MTQSRPQISLFNQPQDDNLSESLSDQESLLFTNKPHQRQPGRPRGRGRPKVNQRVNNKKKTCQEEIDQEKPKPRERPNPAKQENVIEPYVKIVDYLKRIDCDEASFQNKMNPYNCLTPSCFWYTISAQYYSYDFFAKNNPLDAANQILNRVSRVPIQMSTRFIKNTRQGKTLEFQTQEVRKQSDEITEHLSNLIPNPLITGKLQNIEKKLSLSTVTEDNEFIASTRAILFNYIKSKIQKSDKWALNIKSRLQVINNLQPKQFLRRPPLNFQDRTEQIVDASQLDILSRQVKKKKVQKKEEDEQNLDKPGLANPESSSHSQNIDNETPSRIKPSDQNPQQKMDLQLQEFDQKNKILQKKTQNNLLVDQKKQIDEQRSETQSQKTFLKQMSQDEVLLSTIISLPLDKVISVLESTIPKLQLPAIYPPFMPIPKSDPLEFIFQLHEDEEKYLEYMKQYKKKLYQTKIKKSEVIIEEEQRETQFEDAKCQICTDGDYTDDNLIVFCSTCNISLHQRCVGLAKVPAESWVCDVCLAFGPAGINLPCPLCNVKGGAMKRTNIHIDSNLWKEANPSFYEYSKKCPYNKQKQEYIQPQKILPENQNQSSKEDKEELYYDYFNKSTYPQNQPVCHFVWVHYVCSIWIPECYFEQKNGAINVKGIENIQKKRYKHECFVCKKLKAGACVKCQEPECRKYYHPECARKKKVYMQQLNLQKIKYLIFCQQHQPLKITRQIEYKKKKNRDEIIKFARMIEKYIETYKIAIFPFKLMKIVPTKSFIQTFEGEPYLQDQEIKPEIIRQSDEEFVKQIIIKLSKLKKISITVQKTETGLKIIDSYQPSRREMRKCLNKYDDFWHTLLNGDNAEQNCKRYEKIMKENFFLKDKMQIFLNGGSLAGSTKQLNKASQKSKKAKARGKNANTQGQTIIEEEGGIFCICRKPYQNELDMIECQICGEWYHYRCIGFIGTEVDAQTLEFHCMKCMKFQSQQQKKPRLQKCIHLFSTDSLYLNYSPPTPKLMSEEDPNQIKQEIKLEDQKQKFNLELNQQHNKQNNFKPDLNDLNKLNKINEQKAFLKKAQQNGISQENQFGKMIVQSSKTTKIERQQSNVEEVNNVKQVDVMNEQKLNQKLMPLKIKEEEKSMQGVIKQFSVTKIKKDKAQVKKKLGQNNNLSLKQKLAQLQKSILQNQYNSDLK